MDAESLLNVLADGKCHGGDGVTRALRGSDAHGRAVTARLRRWGLHVTGAPDVGYRLEHPLDLVHADALRVMLPPRVRDRLDRLEVFVEIDSTNRHLLEHPPAPGTLAVCLAEYQSAGRGRRGRRWRAPLGAALCLSVAWSLHGSASGISGLALAVGIAARRAVAEVTGKLVALKWPNDLVWDDRKLGGILLEVGGPANARHVVAGVGINVSVPAAVLGGLSDWPGGAVDLAHVSGGAVPSKASLAAALVSALAAVAEDYEPLGFEAYREEWRQADWLRGRRVRVDAGGAAPPTEGKALGIDDDGALLVRTDDERPRRVVGGEVTVRSLP